MDKTLLKNFAIYARNKLIQEITNKASMIGITDRGIVNPLTESTTDMLIFDIKAVETYKIYDNEVQHYNKLKEELEKRQENDSYAIAFNTLIEEIAYTWFNRLIAIRFMEVNNYLPDKMRVLSSGKDGVNEPELVTNYYDTSLEFTAEEQELLLNWKMDGSNIAMEKMFHLLFIKQCNALNKNLSELFEETNDYSELLLTISYNDPDGVLYKLVHDIPEEYFDIDSEDGNGQVEIIGWMYQYYNTERKDEVINIYKGIVKKEDIPAATQIFTTDWVVRYMVDNSLGKYWLERNPNSSIKGSLKYLMPGEIPVVDEKISPEDLKVFDNAMGSGHCLSYAFDVLLMIYKSEGYTAREASRLIVEKNIYGLDIDKRAYQLAYFAIMMKARQYNRRALNGDLENNLAVFEDSISINKNHLKYLGSSMIKEKRKNALEQINYLINEFENATEIGSILLLEGIDNNLVLEFINDSLSTGQILMGEVKIDETQGQLRHLLKITSILTLKYDVVVTNPPYLNKFSTNLKKYVWDNYSDYKSDLFAVFIYNNLRLCKLNGYSACMTPNVWMFIKSYEKLREYLVSQKHIDSLIQIAKGAFYKEATVDVMTFVTKCCKSDYHGKFIRLEDFKGDMELQRIKTLEAIESPKCGYYHLRNQFEFKKIPGTPIAHWLSSKWYELFENRPKVEDIVASKAGIVTGKDSYFIKLWFEVNFNEISLVVENKEEYSKYHIMQKGGQFRRYYGNNEFVLLLKDLYDENKTNVSVRRGDKNAYFQKVIGWSLVGSNNQKSFRMINNSVCGTATPTIIFRNCKDNIYYNYLLGLLNTKISDIILNIFNPTLNLQSTNVYSIPFILNNDKHQLINKKVINNIDISKDDWNLFETSWDFKAHPLLNKKLDYLDIDLNNESIKNTIEENYNNFKQSTNKNFIQLKINEEELNRVFIEIYGLEDELSPEVSEKDITITRIFDHKNEIHDDIKGNRYILTKEDVIKSFISYSIGCIFGRYSLDVEGVIYAGGEWDHSKYNTLIPNKENIVLISDDKYLEDDMVDRFIEFVKVTYGKEFLDENLQFISEALGGKGEPKDIIRNYFIKDFYKDHVQRYQKRPIYWLYDSGKENGFKALIYMHRYNEDTTGKLRIDYLHKMQKTYESTIDDLKYDIANNNNPREVAISEKRLIKITKQLKECKDYDEKIAHLAIARIPIDLDDGVKVNYDKIQTDEKGKNLNILAKI